MKESRCLMNLSYNKVLQRLSAYRKQMGITQEEMGEKMGITQSHYSKLEQGKKLISGAELLKLWDAGIDFDYFFTGDMRGKTELDGFLERYPSPDRQDLLLVIISGIYLCIRQSAPTSERAFQEKQIQLLFFRVLNLQQKEMIWQDIRFLNGKSQLEMAELLGINIKKYRKIEKGQQLADSEVLTMLYAQMGIPPSIILDAGNAEAAVLNHLWKGLDQKQKEYLLDIIQRTAELV